MDEATRLNNFITDSATQYKNAFISYANTSNNEARKNAISTRAFGNYKNKNVKDVIFDGVNPQNFSTITDLRPEFENKYGNLLSKLEALIPNEFNNLLSKLFPKEQYFNEVLDFLYESVKNGSIGLPETVERQLWDRARERVVFEERRSISELSQNVSANGFSMPTGAMLYREMGILNESSKNISALNRDIAIEVAKLRIEWMKFATQSIIDARYKAIDAVLQYLNRVLQSYEIPLNYANSYVGSYRSFYDSLNTYYSAVSNINNLKLRKAEIMDSIEQRGVEERNQRFFNHDKVEIDVLMDTSRQYASQAASALSSVQAVGAIVNQSISNI